MMDWLPISSVDGRALGWVKPSQVVYVGSASGQRVINYIDHAGKVRLACREYGYDDDEFMRKLGLATGDTNVR